MARGDSLPRAATAAAAGGRSDAPAPSSAASPAGQRMRTGEFVFLIASLMALNAMAIDIALPAQDDILRAFGLAGEGGSDNRQQLIIYAYIWGFGTPQLVFGPISDRFGRKGLLLGALAGYAALGLACAFAPSFGALLALRFLQGVSAGAIRVIAVSVVRDCFEGRAMARIMSLVMTVFMLVPILAPMLGEAILILAPWRWIFVSLTVASILLMGWAGLRLSESLDPENRRPLSLGRAFAGYGEVLQNRVTRGYMLASGFVFGSLFTFVASSEQIFSDVFGLEDTYVFWFAGVAALLAVANFTNSRIVERFGMRRISHAVLLAFIFLAAILMLVMHLTDQAFLPFYVLFAAMFACFGMLGANFNALAMEPMGKLAGTASALYGFATTTLSSLLATFIGLQFDGTVFPVIAGFISLGLASLLIILITERGRLFGA